MSLPEESGELLDSYKLYLGNYLYHDQGLMLAPVFRFRRHDASQDAVSRENGPTT
ncbi:uncharacterized protein TrAtP1_000824 [Trichoderma atroviride]|uniref:uncharacterized protein n=1 Tax=Hypocrea atroviridis TaxID=63577 RepID=UPI003318EA1C|nr:hypothetical protein TrAtP1_000824 [Trichoderma atroviride]